MKPPPLMLNAPETQSVLSMVLRELHGADARLQNWTACPASKRGKHRTVRYDLEAQVAGEPRVRKYQWAGKFCERDEDARKLAAILRELGAAYGCVSGILSAHSLLVAKSAVELIIKTVSDRDNQFGRWQSWMPAVLPQGIWWLRT